MEHLVKNYWCPAGARIGKGVQQGLWKRPKGEPSIQNIKTHWVHSRAEPMYHQDHSNESVQTGSRGEVEGTPCLRLNSSKPVE